MASRMTKIAAGVALVALAGVSFKFAVLDNVYWTVLSPIVNSFSETDFSTTSAIVEIISNSINALCGVGGLYLTYRATRSGSAS